MVKFLKTVATVWLYSALFVVAMNAVFTMDLWSFSCLAAVGFAVGNLHAAMWG